MALFDMTGSVMKTELTQYGKYLLSKGKFKPVYYTFDDTDVLYDGLFAGITEQQNNVHTRIKGAVRPETQYVYDGIETEMLRRRRMPSTPEKHYSLTSPIGTCSPSGSMAPNWNIRFLNGRLINSIGYITGSYQTLKIPQLSSSIEFQTKIGFGQTEEEIEELKDQISPTPEIEASERIYDDGSYIIVEDDYLFLQIEEGNTLFEHENFDIEIYRLETSNDERISGSIGRKKEIYVPLNFVKKETNINESLVLEEKEEQVVDMEDLTTDFVEYYLDIAVDTEIDESVFCLAKKKNKVNNILTDINISCPEERKTSSEDIYTIEVDEAIECDE